MRLVTFGNGVADRLGASLDEAVLLDLADAARGAGLPELPFGTMLGLIEAGADAWDRAQALVAAAALTACCGARSAVVGRSR